MREKRQYLVERFKTKEGLFEFFTATAVWYFLIVKYIEQFYASIFQFWAGFIPIQLLAQYISYLSLSIIFSAIGYGLSWIIVKAYHSIKNKRR